MKIENVDKNRIGYVRWWIVDTFRTRYLTETKVECQIWDDGDTDEYEYKVELESKTVILVDLIADFYGWFFTTVNNLMGPRISSQEMSCLLQHFGFEKKRTNAGLAFIVTSDKINDVCNP